MEYRTFDSHGDDSEVEREDLRDYAQSLVYDVDPNGIMDTLLILANICELRATFTPDGLTSKDWYQGLGEMLRFLLKRFSSDKNALAKPHEALEDLSLYLPDPEQMH